jgi:hypothetical protein
MSVLQEYKIGETGEKTIIAPTVLENRKSQLVEIKNPLVVIITELQEVTILDPAKINIIESKIKYGKFELDSKIISEKIVKIYVPDGMLVHLKTGSNIYSFYGADEYVRLYFMNNEYKIIDNTRYLNIATYEIECNDLKIDQLFLVDNYVVFENDQKLDCFKLKNSKLEPHPVSYNCNSIDVFQYGEDFFSLIEQKNDSVTDGIKIILYMNKLEPITLFTLDHRYKNIKLYYCDVKTNNCIFKSDQGIYKVNFIRAEYELITFNKINIKITSENYDNLDKYIELTTDSSDFLYLVDHFTFIIKKVDEKYNLYFIDSNFKVTNIFPIPDLHDLKDIFSFKDCNVCFCTENDIVIYHLTETGLKLGYASKTDKDCSYAINNKGTFIFTKNEDNKKKLYHINF